MYFAYGSNLNSADLLSRQNGFDVDDLTPVGSAYLLDRDLQFTRRSKNRGGGVLDVVPRRGSAVPGILFNVKNEDVWKILDKKEGAPKAYQRICCTAALPSGELIPVITYEVCSENRIKEGFVKPTAEYLDIVREGYDKYNLPTSSLEAAATGENPSSALDSIFIYGTLMRYEERHHFINKASPECILLAEAYGHLIDCGRYPAYIPTYNGEREMVQGEFCRFRIGTIPLEILDRIEGFYGWENQGNLYHRTVISVGMCDGRVRIAWTYSWAGYYDECRVIHSGDWRIKTGSKDLALQRIVTGHIGGGTEIILLKKLNADWYSRISKSILEAMKSGELSERKLAQASGEWCVC